MKDILKHSLAVVMIVTIIFGIVITIDKTCEYKNKVKNEKCLATSLKKGQVVYLNPAADIKKLPRYTLFIAEVLRVMKYKNKVSLFLVKKFKDGSEDNYILFFTKERYQELLCHGGILIENLTHDEKIKENK